MWPPEADRSVSELLLPRHYGSVPTLFGAPEASVDDLSGADVAFHDYAHPDFPGVAQAVAELGLEGEAPGGLFVWFAPPGAPRV